jgi:hypothetical protein
MPEEIEIDTDKLRETIDEEIEHSGSKMLRWVSLTTAILAAVAAVASLRAGDTVNEALALKSDATRIQAQASRAPSRADRSTRGRPLATRFPPISIRPRHDTIPSKKKFRRRRRSSRTNAMRRSTRPLPFSKSTIISPPR